MIEGISRFGEFSVVDANAWELTTGSPSKKETEEFFTTGIKGPLWEPRINPATKWPIVKGARISPVSREPANVCKAFKSCNQLL
jgi:hypothetical protein